jgi:microcystin-dependent protein
MGTPFIGEIRVFAGNFAPTGWAICDGRLLLKAQNQALFDLIGTTYGGDGQTNFAVPDLRGRVPIQKGNGFALGQKGGTETVALSVSQIPTHSHAPGCQSASGDFTSPLGHVWAGSADALLYADANAPTTPMNINSMAVNGGGVPHDNMLPFVGLNFIIALVGDVPA